MTAPSETSNPLIWVGVEKRALRIRPKRRLPSIQQEQLLSHGEVSALVWRIMLSSHIFVLILISLKDYLKVLCTILYNSV